MDNELTQPGADLLFEELLDSPGLDVFLQRLVAISAAKLDEAGAGAHCSITVGRKRRPFTIASSDPETAAMDEVQYAANQGPCMEALKTGQPVEVLDFHTTTRWPRYTAAMANRHMRSVLALPIPLHGAGSAALNCYSPYRGPVPDQVREALLDFTAVAGRALTLGVKLQTQADLAADLTAAMESRTAIDLAAGVIMAQTHCDQKQAVDILIKASSHRNQKLKDVALSVLGRFNGSAPDTQLGSF